MRERDDQVQGIGVLKAMYRLTFYNDPHWRSPLDNSVQNRLRKLDI